jgi:flagellar hook protein FlgE
MRSLFSAVSGLRTHQTRMDVIGNNIANVNTPGYKSSRVTFQEVFSQTLRGASSPSGSSTAERGGTNPMQVGLGVNVASIDTIQTPGNLQPTSRLTDVAIEGNGFFVVQDGESLSYTRVGNFSTDGDGILVDYEGRKVLGWPSRPDGNLPINRTGQNLEPLSIQVGSNMPAKATSNVQWIKNLDAEASNGFSKTTAVTVYDSLGRTHSISVTFTRDMSTDPNTWSWSAELSGIEIGQGTVSFDNSGSFVSSTGDSSFTFGPAGADQVTVEMDFNGLTQVAGPTTVESGAVDGWPTGTLESYSFDSNGVISGFYSNGKNRILGQIALAGFRNPSGLIKAGKNLYIESNNSGAADIGPAGTSGRGTVAPTALEMSNVDLAEEFTQMIITQRGFQANSRVITVSDELLQELVNLKR